MNFVHRAYLGILFIVGAARMCADDFPAFEAEGHPPSVIIPAEYMSQHPLASRQPRDPSLTPIYWTPDAGTIARAESGLLEFLKLLRRVGHKPWTSEQFDQMIGSLETGRRQYIGRGTGSVYIIVIPEGVDAPNWRRELIDIFDGPTGSWSIEFTPADPVHQPDMSPYWNLHFQAQIPSHSPGEPGVIVPQNAGN